MTTPECEFVLAASVTDAEVAGALDVHVGRPVSEERVLLDSFDARLRAAGLQAYWAGGELALIEPGAPRRVGAPEADRYRVADLPRGPLRDRLADVLEERALLPVARVQATMRPLAVLNDDAKTVTRLAVERLTVLAPGGGRIALAPRLRVQAVRGYDGAFARTQGLVRQALRPEQPVRPLFDEAVEAAGRQPGCVSSKPRVKLHAGMAAGTAAGLVLVRLAEIAEANVPGTLDDLDSEFLHDLRVSVRRARSVLRELKDVFPRDALARLRSELRWVQARTGPVRDLDVQLLEWERLAGLLPPDRAADLAPLRRLLEERRAHELAALRRGLRSARFAAALKAWRALATAATPDPSAAGPLAATPIELVGGARIRRVYGRMVRDGSAVGPDSPPEALHELRKRGKELRYLLEFFGDLYPSRVVKPMVSSLKDLQDVLGRFQDRAVQVERLRAMGDELAAAAEGPRALIAVGSLVDALEADQRDARAGFEDRFAAFASKRERGQVKRTFPKSVTA